MGCFASDRESPELWCVSSYMEYLCALSGLTPYDLAERASQPHAVVLLALDARVLPSKSALEDIAQAEELERVTAGPGVGGMLLVPYREPGMDESVLPADLRAIMTIVGAASEPMPAREVSVKLGRGTTPRQVEPVRDRLKHLAGRGWLHRTPAGRFTIVGAE